MGSRESRSKPPQRPGDSSVVLPPRDGVLSTRSHDGPGRATFIVTDGAQRVGLVRVDDLEDPTPTFDLRIAAAHRGRGHGAAALRELARWVFDTHDVERLEGTTGQDNVAMRHTFRAVGFVKEAHYRRGWPTRDGRLLDAVGYALLPTDWRDGTTTRVHWNDC